MTTKIEGEIKGEIKFELEPPDDGNHIAEIVLPQKQLNYSENDRFEQLVPLSDPEDDTLLFETIDFLHEREIEDARRKSDEKIDKLESNLRKEKDDKKKIAAHYEKRIAAKTVEIDDLKAQKSELGKEMAILRLDHRKQMDIVNEKLNQKEQNLTEQMEQSVKQQDLIQQLQSEKASFTEELTELQRSWLKISLNVRNTGRISLSVAAVEGDSPQTGVTVARHDSAAVAAGQNGPATDAIIQHGAHAAEAVQSQSREDTVDVAQQDSHAVQAAQHDSHAVQVARHDSHAVQAARHDSPSHAAVRVQCNSTAAQAAQHDSHAAQAARHDPYAVQVARHDSHAVQVARHDSPSHAAVRVQYNSTAAQAAQHDLHAAQAAQHDSHAAQAARHNSHAAQAARHDSHAAQAARHDSHAAQAARHDSHAAQAARHDSHAAQAARHDSHAAQAARHDSHAAQAARHDSHAAQAARHDSHGHEEAQQNIRAAKAAQRHSPAPKTRRRHRVADGAVRQHSRAADEDSRHNSRAISPAVGAALHCAKEPGAPEGAVRTTAEPDVDAAPSTELTNAANEKRMARKRSSTENGVKLPKFKRRKNDEYKMEGSTAPFRQFNHPSSGAQIRERSSDQFRHAHNNRSPRHLNLVRPGNKRCCVCNAWTDHETKDCRSCLFCRKPGHRYDKCYTALMGGPRTIYMQQHMGYDIKAVKQRLNQTQCSVCYDDMHWWGICPHRAKHERTPVRCGGCVPCRLDGCLRKE